MDATTTNTAARLFSVHLWLVATVRDRSGRSRDESTSKRLVVQATDESSARAKAITWLEAESTGPVAHLTFAVGTRDAVRVRLAEVKEPVGVYPVDGCVVPL